MVRATRAAGRTPSPVRTSSHGASRIRVGIVGCGKITQRLALPQLAACPDAEVAALVDINRAAASRLATRFAVDPRRIWTDWRRMLRSAEVDAIAVCVPNALHAEVAIAALEAKKHVLVEKPMALTLDEADAMVAAARASRRYLFVEQTQRFDPVHETAYEVLRSGRLGRLHMVRGRIGHAGPEYWSPTSRWFLNRREAGGGAIMDVGAHIVDLLRWFVGARVRRVCAVAKTLQKSIRVEDNAGGLLEFADGTLGAFEVSWTTRPYEVSTCCYAERGQLRTAIGTPEPVIVRRSRPSGDPNLPGEEQHPAVSKTSRHGGAYPYFVRCIAQRIPPFVSGEEGRSTLEVILAVYRSIADRCWVELPGR